jgi:hypothetical protein
MTLKKESFETGKAQLVRAEGFVPIGMMQKAFYAEGLPDQRKRINAFLKQVKRDGYHFTFLKNGNIIIGQKTDNPHQAKLDFIERYSLDDAPAVKNARFPLAKNNKYDQQKLIDNMFIVLRQNIIGGDFKEKWHYTLVRELSADEDVFRLYQNWSSTDKFARKRAWKILNDKIRNIFGKMDDYIIACEEGVGPGSAKAAYGRGDKGRSADMYLVNMDALKIQDFASVLSAIIHENFHFFQMKGMTDVPLEFLKLNQKNYARKSPLYAKQPLELENFMADPGIAERIIENLKKRTDDR